MTAGTTPAVKKPVYIIPHNGAGASIKLSFFAGEMCEHRQYAADTGLEIGARQSA